MIELTKLDDSSILLNLEMVKYIESVPDTLITFINGETILVKETTHDLEQKIIHYKANILKYLEKIKEKPVTTNK